MDQSRDRIQVRRNRVLLVEGPEDARLLSALVQPPTGIQILEMGGKDRLKEVLDLVLQDARRIGGLQAIGVVRDADEEPLSAFQSVRDALQSKELNPPNQHGEYSESDRPAVGIFITPDGSSPGSLESLCVRSVQEAPEARCAEEYLQCVAEVRLAEWNTARRSKAFAYAYQAASADPGNRLSVGVAQGVWNRDSSAFGPLRAFVRQLTTVGGSAGAE